MIKKIRRWVILIGNLIVAVLLLLNIKEVKTDNDYRFNLVCFIIFSILILVDVLIIALKKYKKEC